MRGVLEHLKRVLGLQKPPTPAKPASVQPEPAFIEIELEELPEELQELVRAFVARAQAAELRPYGVSLLDVAENHGIDHTIGLMARAHGNDPDDSFEGIVNWPAIRPDKSDARIVFSSGSSIRGAELTHSFFISSNLVVVSPIAGAVMSTEVPVQAIQAWARSVAGLPPNGAAEGLADPYASVLQVVEAADRMEKADALGAELGKLGLDAPGVFLRISSMDLEEAPPPAEYLLEGGSPLQELPDEAKLDIGLAWGSALWLNEYTSYAAKIAPMSPRMWHESAALWLVSVAIARRLVLPMNFGDIYPNIWVSWIAGSSVWNKTTSLNIAKHLVGRCMPWLMVTGNVTPESLLSDLSGDQPKNYEQLTMDMKDEWGQAKAFASKRAMVMDEMSLLLAASARDYNAGLPEMLLQLYDCTDDMRRLTRSQGLMIVKSAYLPFLGASTPRALSTFLGDAKLWGMGWWPRFAMLTPDRPYPEYKEASDPGSQQHLVDALMELYGRLPVPEASEPLRPLEVSMTEGARAAWKRYDVAVRYSFVISGDLDDRLDGTYTRLPTHVLKVAMICAALDWQKKTPAPMIDLPHMARAIQICEGWRASAHRVLAGTARTKFVDLQCRILRVLDRVGAAGVSVRDLYRVTGKDPDEVETILKKMEKLGDLEEMEVPTTRKGGRPSKKYRRLR